MVCIGHALLIFLQVAMTRIMTNMLVLLALNTHPPWPRSPDELQDNSKSLAPVADSVPTHYLPGTDRKFRIDRKLRVSGGAEHQQVVNQFDPEATQALPPRNPLLPL